MSYLWPRHDKVYIVHPKRNMKTRKFETFSFFLVAKRSENYNWYTNVSILVVYKISAGGYNKD